MSVGAWASFALLLLIAAAAILEGAMEARPTAAISEEDDPLGRRLRWEPSGALDADVGEELCRV
ncbi:hypothetical protein SAT01_07020 [Sinomonas atrocyanea]|nr:hypothetical protein SAT01_07020 [Sinomonas atrocyanea]GGG69635.1 hypothetical protein GCM10007172_22230 [Sinomonas atrocyanea]